MTAVGSRESLVTRRLRLWCLAGAIGVAAFATYISLVPFRFQFPADVGQFVSGFQRRLEVGMTSRGNFLANVWLFIPIGFLGTGALAAGTSSVFRNAAAGVAALVVSAAVSTSIELLQSAVPHRTPSATDISAHVVGAAAGCLAWMVLGGEVSRWVASWGARRSRPETWITLLAIYTVGRAAVILYPLDVSVDLGALATKFRNGMIVLNPLASSVWTLEAWPETIADLMLAIPIGILASVWGVASGTRRATLAAVLMASLFFALIELAQVAIVSRTADAGDLVVNLLGVLVGVFAASAFINARVSRGSSATARLPFVGLMTCLVVYLAYNWSPFDFGLSPEMIRARAPRLIGVPFHGYYVNPEFKALSDIVIKMAVALPIGMFLSLWMKPLAGSYRRVAVVAVAVLAAVFFGVVEAGQVLLPSRYPDGTDVLLALAGVFVGWRLPGVWTRRAGRAGVEGERTDRAPRLLT